jgi:hypothetical protein
MSFVSEYRNLIIKQYWDKPKARAEIEFLAGTYNRTYDWLESFLTEFDVDLATGDRLEIIGRVVGVKRSVPFVIEKIAFGFDENTNSRGFDDKFAGPIANSAPFQDKFERAYTTLQLDDNDYRFFIKAKIAKNSGSSFMVSDVKVSLQDVISTLFERLAYVVDNKDMSLTLYLSPSIDLERVRSVQSLGLLPKPQGVKYYIVGQAAPGETFGFADNVNSVGFKDAFNPITEPGGRFATKVF